MGKTVKIPQKTRKKDKKWLRVRGIIALGKDCLERKEKWQEG